MNLCVAVAGGVLSIAATDFTLSWTHSVERTEWRESWSLDADGLQLLEARVRGSGAGMDPGEDARQEGGWWVWEPSLPSVPVLVLAASGSTGEGWTLCAAGRCRALGTREGEPVRVAPCHER